MEKLIKKIKRTTSYVDFYELKEEILKALEGMKFKTKKVKGED